MSEMPFDKWYWSDWFGDPGIALLNPVSRCVWFELLGRMHQKTVYTLERTAEDIATECRISVNQALEAIEDLRRREVGKITIEGNKIIILSHRRQRDMKKAAASTERVNKWRQRNGSANGNDEADGMPEGREVKVRPTKPSQVIAVADKIGYLMSQYEAEKFLADHKSVDWKNRYGQPITDWTELLKTWKNRQTPEQRRQALDERGGDSDGKRPKKEVVL